MSALPSSLPTNQPPCLIEQVRYRLCTLHYSCRTEPVYVYSILYFIRFSAIRHRREMGRMAFDVANRSPQPLCP